MIAFAEPGPVTELRRLLRALRLELNMRVAFASTYLDGMRVFQIVDAVDEEGRVVEGEADPYAETLCHWIATGELPRLMTDTRDVARAREIAATLMFPVGANLSTPLRAGDGRIFGSLCCFDTAPRPELTERHLRRVERCGETAARLMEAAGLTDAALRPRPDRSVHAS